MTGFALRKSSSAASSWERGITGNSERCFFKLCVTMMKEVCFAVILLLSGAVAAGAALISD